MGAKTRKRLIGKEKLLNMMAARTFAYSFLTRAFLDQPVKEYIQLLVDENIVGSFPITEGNASLKEGLETLTFFFRDPDLLADEVIDELTGEYNRLFIGMGRKESIAPYESVYLSPDRMVFQQETMAVRTDYARYDLRPERFQQEPDDHIGLELDFMSKLSERSLAELRADRWHKTRRMLKAQRGFLKDHLLKWAPKLSADIIKKTESDFFKGMANVLVGYLTVDKELVEDLIGEISERLKRNREKEKALAKTS